MYKIIRCVVIISVVLLPLVFRKQIRTNKKMLFLLLLGGSLTCYLLFVNPIENLFYSFDSPEKVFSYRYNVDALQTIEGSKSALVFSKNKEGTLLYEIVPKSDNGWKLPNVENKRVVLKDFYNMTHILIYECNSVDYYILVDAYGVSDIADNKGSFFYSESHTANDKPVTSGFAYLQDIIDYTLLLDGETVELKTMG